MAVRRNGGDRLALRALRNREEIAREGFTRRQLLKMGLLSSGGLLVAQRGLSAWASSDHDGDCQPGMSPKVESFVQPLPMIPVLPQRAVSELSPAPTIAPNRAVNPATGLPFEGRTEAHQTRSQYPAEQYFISRMGANAGARLHPDLPPQTLWGFNLGGADLHVDPPHTPGPIIVTRYGKPVVVRRYNALPPAEQNGGFGVPEVSTHLHNCHTAPDSDGTPCHPVEQRYFFRGQYYDYFYNMQYAGFDAGFGPHGNIQEAMSTLWYHDHRVGHTAENVYKGLAGFHLFFNEFDTGDESTGFHLPSFPDFDVPLFLTDKLIDPETGLLCFDTFGFDGLVGDTFCVNFKVQPFFEVHKRRYRFRLLDGGPSRFYQLYLTNPDDPSQQIPFYAIASDGNLLPRPVEVSNLRLSVAERTDIIIDFAAISSRFGNPARLHLENRLVQDNGRGPTDDITAPGRGTPLLEFRLVGGKVADDSFDPEPVATPRNRCAEDDAVFAPITLPDISETPRVTRRFRFERGDGQWQINGRLMDCTEPRFKPQRNSLERWILTNGGGGWSHPIHVHMEEHRVVRRNGQPVVCGDRHFGRKDVIELGPNDEVEILMRFRDYRGIYPMHCHNTIHEDHQMMLLFEVDDAGDRIEEP